MSGVQMLFCNMQCFSHQAPAITTVSATSAQISQRPTQQSAHKLRWLTDMQTLPALLFCTALLALCVAFLLQSLSVAFNILLESCNTCLRWR